MSNEDGHAGREPVERPAGATGANGQTSKQAQEIERLKRRLGDEPFASELRHTLALAATAGTIASPVSHSRLLEMIVETAAHVISAQAASLFLIDKDTEELSFEVALGQKAEEVKKFKVPLGHGIAGYVALSGQPIAISDAQHDPRHAADISRSIGYTPNSILCVPLFYNDQIIGVLELLDKMGAPSFTPADIQLLGAFANQAAVALEQARMLENLSGLVIEVLRQLNDTADPDRRQRAEERAREYAARLGQDSTYRRALALARQVRDIARQGDNEFALCQTILGGFAEYLRARAQPFGALGSMPWSGDLGGLR